ncbi:MAG: type I-U CRISPR-associated protein Cas5/Cas6 [Acidimicrobiia bacterium]|nr:type I-U CRISPR-associated protein Cas5/Cas6 [Acidimicrobiia bacterium]MYC58242.1 type I-U CRISPR-associated protein Cas5/Cas6 [Acidimicrobiia bacterium]MYI30116.1 type I-U CRISPR-associated protein Cas5/Cas6 [Acidimicrobiia bacterium]
MLAIEVNFLTGRYVATAHNDRESSEWPPHPARLFSALVASWAEAGEDDAEREVLEWMEALPPPSLGASDVDPRKVVSYFVPVNDTRVISGSWYERCHQKLNELEDQFEAELELSGGELTKKAERTRNKIQKVLDVDSQVSNVGTTSTESALDMLPDVRGKQERHFPSVTPRDARVTFVWVGAHLSVAVRSSLDDLLSRVTRLGHSSSLVSCRIVDDSPSLNWTSGSGSHVLRCTGPGQLTALEERYKQHQAIKPRSLPFDAVRYSDVSVAADIPVQLRPDTVGDWIVFEFLLKSQSRRFPSTRAVEVATTMRGAVMSHAEDPIPEGLSGHQSDGAPTLEPHVAFLPLSYVGFEHSDGRIMGLAMSLPVSLEDESRRAALRAIGRWEQEAESNPLVLAFGSAGILQLQRRSGPIDLVTIRPERWRKPSLRWVSALPIALPTHPGPLGRGSAAARAKAWKRAEQAVAASCRHVGLPEPIHIEVSLDPFIRGARPAADFPPFCQRGRDGKPVARRLVHAALVFDQPVVGPLVLGAGRFLGLGLMRPIDDSATMENARDVNG